MTTFFTSGTDMTYTHRLPRAALLWACVTGSLVLSQPALANNFTQQRIAPGLTGQLGTACPAGFARISNGQCVFVVQCPPGQRFVGDHCVVTPSGHSNGHFNDVI